MEDNKVVRQKYDPSAFDRRAIPTDADGKPIDVEHGNTLDSMTQKTFSHDRFQRPDGTHDYDKERLPSEPLTPEMKKQIEEGEAREKVK